MFSTEKCSRGRSCGCNLLVPKVHLLFLPESLTCLWQPSTIISFCWGEVRAKTISEWLRRMSSSCSEVMSFSSIPLTTAALASLQKPEAISIKAAATPSSKMACVHILLNLNWCVREQWKAHLFKLEHSIGRKPHSWKMRYSRWPLTGLGAFKWDKWIDCSKSGMGNLFQPEGHFPF